MIQRVDRRWIKVVSRDMLRQRYGLRGAEWLKCQFCYQTVWLPCAKARYEGMSRENILSTYGSKDQ